MRKIKLKPNSNKLRTRINDHGEIWEWPKLTPGTHTPNEQRSMDCFQGQAGITIVSLNGIHIRNARMIDVEEVGEIHE
jgi:hypothetical protein